MLAINMPSLIAPKTCTTVFQIWLILCILDKRAVKVSVPIFKLLLLHTSGEYHSHHKDWSSEITGKRKVLRKLESVAEGFWEQNLKQKPPKQHQVLLIKIHLWNLKCNSNRRLSNIEGVRAWWGIRQTPISIFHNMKLFGVFGMPIPEFNLHCWEHTCTMTVSCPITLLGLGVAGTEALWPFSVLFNNQT